MGTKTAILLTAALVVGAVAAVKPGAEREVTVLLMADTHAALNEHPEVFFDAEDKPSLGPAGGYALLAGAIRKEREAHPQQTMLVNVGDTIHGSAVAEWTEGAAIVPVVNALGIDVFVPGNWEYAYGPEAFRKRMSELNHPVAAINLFDEASGKRMFAPSVVKTVNGVRVGVVGITSTIVKNSMAPDYGRGLRFTFKEGVQEEVDRLRKDGVEIVLLATELGLAQEVKLAREIKNVDFILGGHTHERSFVPNTEGGTPVIEAGSEGSFLARVTFKVKDGRVAGFDHKLLEVTPDRYQPDAKVAELVAKAREPFAERLSKVVGQTETDLFRKGVLESTMDNVIADALREASGADIGMTNGFRFSYPIPKGAMTEEDLYNMFPMDAPIKVGRLTGRQLRDFWEESLEQVFASNAYGQKGGWGPRPSGMTVRAMLRAPKGKRVVWMKVGDRVVKDDDSFTVASCDRPGDSGDTLCRFGGAQETKVLPVTIQQAMRSYLEKHPRISPAIEARVSVEGPGGRVWSQYELSK